MDIPVHLGDTLRPGLPLSEHHRRCIAYIDEHDFSGVLRKVREEQAALGLEHPQAWYDDGLLALKQYYAVALLDGHNMHAVSDRVDPFWHAHILHTRQYTEFGEQTTGAYMHHDPLDHADAEAVDHVDVLYHFTRRRYDEIFTYVSEHFNPRTLARHELICVHHRLGTEAADHAIFAPHPDGQERVRQH